MSRLKTQRCTVAITAMYLTVLLVISFVLAPGSFADGPLDFSNRMINPEEREAPPSQALFLPGELVVKLADVDSVSIADINATYGTTVSQYLSQLNIFLLNAPAGADLEQLAADMQSHPFILTAHPNYMVDPLQAVQGSFPFSDDKGTGDYDEQPAAGTLHLTDAHGINTGAGAIVGVIDGGVNYNHPIFDGMVQSGYDYVDDDTDAFDEEGGDNSGHGTFVAGVIHLVAPDATIRAYRVSDRSGNSDGYLVAEAILQAVEDGCNVINLSMVMTSEHSAIKDALAYARANDVMVIVAAGNGQSDIPTYPASDPNTICVAALDTLNRLADFSRYGADVDICAPGTGIYSPYLDTGYAWWGGTSFAAPFVSAQAALIISERPEMHSFTRTRGVLLNSAQDIYDVNPEYVGQLGAGLIDPPAALALNQTLEVAWVSPDTLSFTVQEGTEYFAIPRLGAILYSSNAPATYFGEVTSADTGAVFAHLDDSTGVTNDSIVVGVDLGIFPPGTYYNTVEFFVNGVNDPAVLTVKLRVTANPGSGTADVTPDTLFIRVPYGTQGPLARCVELTSSNAPAPFVVTPGYLTQPMDTSGFTNDSVCLKIYPERAGVASLYVDTVSFQIEGVPQPVVLTIWLEIERAPYFNPQYLSFQAQEGNEQVLHGCALLSSENAPQAFSGEVLGGGLFTTLIDTTGTTNDSICVRVDPGGLSVGTYADTVIYYVENNVEPAILPVYLQILDSLPPSGDSAWVQPDTLTFYISNLDFGPQQTQDQVVLLSTNAPAGYFGYVTDTASAFTSLRDSVGVTNDTVMIEVHPDYYGPGVYYNTVLFDVDGVDNPAFLTICMNIDSTVTSDSTAWVTPASMQFQVEEQSAATQAGCLVVGSNFDPAAFSVQILDTADFTTLLVSSGTTPDSVCFEVNSGSLSVGTYRDTLLVTVTGAANNPLMAVLSLTVVSDTVQAPLLEVNVQSLQGPSGQGIAFGDTADISINMLYTAQMEYPIGGYDLLLTYDPTALSLIEAQPGRLLQNCGWEYFNYRTDSIPCSGDCPDGLLRLVAVADLNNGSSVHPSCYASSDGLPPQLANLRFEVTNDTTMACQFSPIRFFWIDCGDNALASVLGDTLFISRQVYDYNGMRLDNSYSLMPHIFGADPSCDATGAIRAVDFRDGGIRLACSDTVVTPGDTAAVIPDTLFFTWYEGAVVTVVPSGCAMLYSSNAPAAYTAFKDTDLVFVTLQDTAGQTNDSVCVFVNPAGMSVGRYSGRVWYNVSGVTESAILTIVLDVLPQPGTGDSAWVAPDTAFISAELGTEMVSVTCPLVMSTNSPASYQVLQDSANVFSIPLKTSGTTPDSVCFQVNPSLMPIGTFDETWWFLVDGVADEFPFTIRLTVTDSIGGGTETASVTPGLLNYTLVPGDTVYACALVSSSNAPASFSAYISPNGQNFTTLLDSVGQTNDSLCLEVSTAQLTSGTYVDTVVVSVAGVPDDVHLYVQLTVSGADSMTVSQNYPNPFNPTTEISFTLPKAAAVKLDIFNVVGQRVTTLVDGQMGAGEHTVTWDASGFASGIYFYRLTAGDLSQTRKMLLMK
ncbi:MAG: S8/S53 family peptidase [Candidatus Zixiibacteriota bacterium]